MRRYLICFSICFGIFCLTITGCSLSSGDPKQIAYETTIVTPTAAATSVFQPTPTATAPFAQFVLPSVTMSSQMAESELLELLNTNGNCTGKCLAGIQPGEMTVQDAINKMASWGTVQLSENSQGKPFINLVQAPPHSGASVKLSLGISGESQNTVDNVSFNIAGPPGNPFISEDIWYANRDAWSAFRLDNILKTYGIPSYVGFFFQTTVEEGASLEGRAIAYNMEIQYEQFNMTTVIGGLANYDGETLFICPTKDPHDLGIEINPERSLKELQGFSPVTWQELTSTDLPTFYAIFTNDVNPDTCIETTLQEVESLQPTFR
jgi:hypothetical protein